MDYRPQAIRKTFETVAILWVLQLFRKFLHNIHTPMTPNHSPMPAITLIWKCCQYVTFLLWWKPCLGHLDWNCPFCQHLSPDSYVFCLFCVAWVSCISISEEPKQTSITRATPFIDVMMLLLSHTLSKQKRRQVKLQKCDTPL